MFSTEKTNHLFQLLFQPNARTALMEEKERNVNFALSLYTYIFLKSFNENGATVISFREKIMHLFILLFIFVKSLITEKLK